MSQKHLIIQHYPIHMSNRTVLEYTNTILVRAKHHAHILINHIHNSVQSGLILHSLFGDQG